MGRRFKTVYNTCECFYNKIYEKTVPEHDVIVTNPPYSASQPHIYKSFATVSVYTTKR